MGSRCIVVNVRHDAFDVYVGRAGRGYDGYFGNPFVIGKDGNRAEVIERFRGWFERKLATDPTYRARVLALRGKRLGCFCAPAACHGHVIAEWVNKQEP